jgi:peptidoglycan/xylan/chitin deacetylase (PgdA/CDA1 family)
MREERMIAVGAVLRRAGAGAVAASLTPKHNVRATVTHFVRERDLDNFRRLLLFLLERRRPLTPPEFFRHFAAGEREPISGQSLLVTFDDGLLSSYVAAQRVLNPLGIKAIFFVPTMVLELETEDEMRRFWEDVYGRLEPPAPVPAGEYRTMSVEQLRELHGQGHMILPHTHTHLELSRIAGDALIEQELVAPKRRLEELLQAPAEGFAFPIGTADVVDAPAYTAVRRNYRLCFTGLHGANSSRTDPYFLHRDGVHAHYSLDHVANIAAGCYDVFYTLKMRRLKRRADAIGT